MKKWIRWQGLVTFFVILFIVSAFWLLFIDGIVKRLIEKQGTRAMGARVELESADLSLFPAGLELINLRVANPDKPMKNALEISRANMSLEAGKLLQRKIIIQEMSLQGVHFNTKRKTSGAIKHEKSVIPKGAKQGASPGFSVPSLEIPKASEILEGEKLESLELVKSLQEDIQSKKETWKKRLNEQSKKETWKKRLNELPDKEKFAEYRKRIQRIKSKNKGGLGGLLTKAGEVSDIKQDIEADLNRIKQAKQDFNRIKDSLSKKLSQAKKAPLQDFERLKNKYALSPEGMANMSQLLFGSRIGGWMQKVVGWYKRLKPMLAGSEKKQKGEGPGKPARDEGVYIPFKEKKPLPDFLIRTANAQLQLEAGDLEGTIKNITNRQDILGVPLTFLFSGEKMKKVSSINISGSLDHVDISSPADMIKIAARGFDIRDTDLSRKGKASITLKTADINLDLKGLVKGETIAGDFVSKFDSVQMGMDTEKKAGPLMSAITSALSNVSGFTLRANITGTLEKYSIDLESDLDGMLKDVAHKAAGKEMEKFERDLKSGIFAKADGPLGQAKSNFGDLSSFGGELDERREMASGLLKNLGPLRGFK